jgi:glucose-6-phosphate 1-dehydrogenase
MAEFIPVPPFDLVVFGATGDLSLRKLFPSLLHRYLDGQIPPQSRIIGVARSDIDTAALPRHGARKPRPVRARRLRR